MFQIEHISKSYGKKKVLNDVSFPVPEGCAIGILGVNGSGKSTLLSCIAKKYAGTPDVRISYVPQENPLYDELKPVDNLRMWTNKRKSARPAWNPDISGYSGQKYVRWYEKAAQSRVCPARCTTDSADG